MVCKFTSATTITSLDQAQVLHKPGIVAGQYEGNATDPRTIDLGFTPRFVVVWISSGANKRMSFSAILPEYHDPADYTSDASLTWNNTPSVSYSTSTDTRPEIAESGFVVSTTTAGDLNDSSVFYNYLAIA